MSERRVGFDDLKGTDLVVGIVYRGGPAGNVGDDPIARLLGVGNMGGFRPVGRPMPHGCLLVGLFTTNAQDDWPDHLDGDTGIFTYYGDNRTPGTDLHDTHKGGNTLLRYMFDSIMGSPPLREGLPPVFIFEQVPSSGRDVRFLGLAAPGVSGDIDARAIEVVSHGEGPSTVTNYRAKFTLLDAPVVSRQWIASLQQGTPDASAAPEAWRHWVETGTYRPRTAETDSAIGDQGYPIQMGLPAAAETSPMRVMVPSGGPNGWRALLGSPAKHWVRGRSTRTMAHCWETADGWPTVVADAIGAVPALADFLPVLGFPELKTPLPGGVRASQTDLMVLASNGRHTMTIAVEGKVDEPLGDYVEVWLGDQPSPGKRQRLDYLAEVLGLEASKLSDIRYQLVHRSAAAKIERDRMGADVAGMLVHAWTDTQDGFLDFQRFGQLIGVDTEVGQLVYSESADLWLGWIRGDDTYLEY